MTSTLMKLGTGSLTVMAIAMSAPAFAAGTTAGTNITNTAFVDYQVGGVSQTQTSGGNTFVVDRKINLLVAEVGAVTTNVSPGQTNAITTFQLTNTSNEVLDFALSATQIVGGTAAHGGTDTFNVSNVRIYRDNAVTGTVGSYDVGDALVTYADELAADTSATLFVLADVPLTGLVTGNVAGVQLRATAREGGGAAAQGAVITETTGANTAAKDTVFADGIGVNDANRDASYSDDDDYTVLTAALTVTKSSLVVSDPFNGTTNPKMIPGAVIQYCIAVANAAGGADATTVAISDSVPAQLTYIASSIRINGTVTSGVCNADGVAGGAYSAPTVSGTIATVAAGATRTLIFQATVN